MERLHEVVLEEAVHVEVTQNEILLEEAIPTESPLIVIRMTIY